jgi:hypothetical protein
MSNLNDQEREALKMYGRHLTGCTWLYQPEKKRCTCGFRGALAAREEPQVECPMCDGSGIRPHSGHDDAGVYPDCLACEGRGDVTAADALLIRVMMYATPSTRETTWLATPQRIALAEDLNSYFDRKVFSAREDIE